MQLLSIKNKKLIRRQKGKPRLKPKIIPFKHTHTPVHTVYVNSNDRLFTEHAKTLLRADFM